MNAQVHMDMSAQREKESMTGKLSAKPKARVRFATDQGVRVNPEGKKLTFSNDESLQLLLLRRPLHNLRLDRMRADQPEDQHRPSLSNPMRPVLRLRVHLWILQRNNENLLAAESKASTPKHAVENSNEGGWVV